MGQQPSHLSQSTAAFEEFKNRLKVCNTALKTLESYGHDTYIKAIKKDRKLTNEYRIRNNRTFPNTTFDNHIAQYCDRLVKIEGLIKGNICHAIVANECLGSVKKYIKMIYETRGLGLELYLSPKYADLAEKIEKAIEGVFSSLSTIALNSTTIQTELDALTLTRQSLLTEMNDPTNILQGTCYEQMKKNIISASTTMQSSHSTYQQYINAATAGVEGWVDWMSSAKIIGSINIPSFSSPIADDHTRWLAEKDEYYNSQKDSLRGSNEDSKDTELLDLSSAAVKEGQEVAAAPDHRHDSDADSEDQDEHSETKRNITGSSRSPK